MCESIIQLGGKVYTENLLVLHYEIRKKNELKQKWTTSYICALGGNTGRNDLHTERQEKSLYIETSTSSMPDILF